MVTEAQSQVLDESKILAVKSIKEFKEKLSIKSIVYVDDKFSFNNLKEEFIGIILRLKSTQPKDFEFQWNRPEQILIKEISSYWDNSGTEVQKASYLIACQLVGNDEHLLNTMPALEFADYFGHDELQCFTPKEWVEKSEDIFKNLKGEEKILCLFDQEFKNGEAPEHFQTGISLLKEIVNRGHSGKAYCAIFSHTFSIEDEYDNWLRFAKEEDIDKKIFYTISKKRYYDEPKIGGFAEGIKNALSIREIDSLKDKSIKIWEEALLIAKKKMQDINPDTFNHIVQKTSKGEGIWEILTFFRLGGILTDHEINKSMISIESRAEFNGSIKIIRDLESVKTGRDSNYNLDALLDIRRKEIYLHGDILNKLHYPITNGDIFAIGEKYFILLEQPCNISIRGNSPIGKRNNNKTTATIVEFVIDEKPNSIKLELPFDKFNYIQCSKSSDIMLSVLDLVTYNENGQSCLNLNSDLIHPEIYHLPLISRYKDIFKEFNAWAKSYKAVMPNLRGKVSQNILDKCCKPVLSLNKIPGLNTTPYDEASNAFNFGIVRLGRLKDPYANDVLSSYTQYLSRNGYEHDFSK